MSAVTTGRLGVAAGRGAGGGGSGITAISGSTAGAAA